MSRRIPAAGINLFQLIYILIREYSEKSGLQPLNLSLGNPDGIPDEAIRRFKGEFAANPGYDYHTYAEDKNLSNFAENMVALHGGLDARRYSYLRALPIAGIKTATALIPLACGFHLRKNGRSSFCVASNLPAYDVIGTWSGSYLGVKRVIWPLLSSENMKLNLDRLKSALKAGKARRPDLIFVIRPGNPAAVGTSASEWKTLIDYCLEHEVRLVNDAAYCGLAEAQSHVSLASVAKDFPELEWLEMYSVSKSFNDPGARLGVMVGSKDFVEDFVMIKGNTDSGPVPSVMAAYGKFLQNRSAASSVLTELRSLYRRRLDYVIPRLKKAGLIPACSTDAGFFTLWKAPKSALGRDLTRDGKMPRQEAFNRLVIAETGLVGVHFQGGEKNDPLIRYAVCADVLDPKFQARFEEQLARLKPGY